MNVFAVGGETGRTLIDAGLNGSAGRIRRSATEHFGAVDRWPQHVQHARVLQHALSRPSKLNAVHTVLHPLSGLPAEKPVRAEEQAVLLVPSPYPPPMPSVDDARVVLAVGPRTDGEAAYVAELFDYRSPRTFW